MSCDFKINHTKFSLLIRASSVIHDTCQGREEPWYWQFTYGMLWIYLSNDSWLHSAGLMGHKGARDAFWRENLINGRHYPAGSRGYFVIQKQSQSRYLGDWYRWQTISICSELTLRAILRTIIWMASFHHYIQMSLLTIYVFIHYKLVSFLRKKCIRITPRVHRMRLV